MFLCWVLTAGGSNAGTCNIYRERERDTAKNHVHHVLSWLDECQVKRVQISTGYWLAKNSIESSSPAVLQSGSNIGIHLPDPWWPVHKGLALAQKMYSLLASSPTKTSQAFLGVDMFRNSYTQNSTPPTGVSLANFKEFLSFGGTLQGYVSSSCVWCSSSPDVTYLNIPIELQARDQLRGFSRCNSPRRSQDQPPRFLWRTKIKHSWPFLTFTGHRDSWLFDIVV